MPLRIDPEPPLYMADWQGQPAMNFRAHVVPADPRDLVSCRVLHGALDWLVTDATGGGLATSEDEMAAAAERFRTTIGEVASAKFDRGEWARDGTRRIVVLGLDDVMGAP
ncbi:MAG: hypothetical protein IT561_27010 [Alphaproteobacteria bacterium]|nr:hypothetical protein [Alphaproteobacteria bacterium]